MIDFTDAPVIDHHCHPYEPDSAYLEPVSLARAFFHGIADIPKPDSGLKPRHWDATDALRFHFPYMGVVQTMICQLARVFGCPADLESVAAERNRRTAESFAEYIRTLYADAGIVGTVLDTGLSGNDPLLGLTPGLRLRLFQMDPAMQRLLPRSESYREFLHLYRTALERGVREEGFIGVKAHLAERAGFHARPASTGEAEKAFAAARDGDDDAYKTLYAETFTETMLLCQELKVPVHLHSGFTGGLWKGPISDADPFLLASLLAENRFLQTRVILLHAGYPWTKQAGQLAHTFPHLWVDMGQMTPWASLRIAECYRDVIAWAPLSKVVVGSGGHGTPEIAWLAAITAKIALREVLGDAVRMALMTEGQAEKAGRMILHDNAARLYNL
jgi:predicted TIM-barrel fold metal-dependent hydrolase